eukprot:gnl/MRDRNA2_/MRDRNA2_96456_c0_seq1.p1 gnl/MRDRNA2_/MRDRNA2_96456_c0~~gnl/MRDRNA2_/MRDRNA2_96456_c0_seq1.p1  ORF type:complete len:826 (+),score=131.00 gnl/MRDRNA2_/MRDRNA2_96456_c0_seq1:125-2602(+)
MRCYAAIFLLWISGSHISFAIAGNEDFPGAFGHGSDPFHLHHVEDDGDALLQLHDLRAKTSGESFYNAGSGRRRRRRSRKRTKNTSSNRGHRRRSPGGKHAPSTGAKSSSKRKSATLSWETGTVDSGLAIPLEPSFSINGNSQVVDRRRKMYVSNRLHNMSVVEVPWAREGSHVLKVCADGRNFGTKRDWGYRSELGAVQDAYTFVPGDYFYYTMSFWPDKSWDQVSKYSTVITQWKMSPGLPHAALRLSNVGDYKLTFRGYDLWEGGKGEGKFIGYAVPQAWNDVKAFFKFSMGRDGIAKVWLNGKLVFDHRGRTLLKRTPRGYVKFGMYTEIRDMRTLYFDAVRFSNFLDVPFEKWLTDQAHLPSVSLKSPNNGSHLPSGSRISIVANAQDPGSQKYGIAGGIAKVEFFAGKCSVGVVSASPCSASFAPSDGPYSLTAVVTDSDGNSATSQVVDVYVGNKPPEVALLSPSQQANVRSSEVVEMKAKASDPDGAISQVTFYAGDEKVGIAKNHRHGFYVMSWKPKKAGAYTLQAVAIDGDGKSGRSKSVRVTVDAKIQTKSVKAMDDASLREGSPSSPGNWGDVEIYGKPGARVVGVFKFDISSFKKSSEIRQAKLRLYAVKGKGGPSVLLVFGAAAKDWREKDVTWSRGPSRADRLSSLTVGKFRQYYEFDVTSYIADMAHASGTLVTFWLEFQDLKYGKVEFESRRDDKRNPPQLKVTTSSIAMVEDTDDAADDGTDNPCKGIRPMPGPTRKGGTSSISSTITSTTSMLKSFSSTPGPTVPIASTTTKTATPCPEISKLKKQVRRLGAEVKSVAQKMDNIAN